MIPSIPTPTFDASTLSGDTPFGDLPEWDLSALYTGEDAPELTDDLNWLQKECAQFAADYQGKLEALSGADMLTCITRDERITTVAGRLGSYAGLRYYQNTVDADRAKFFSDIQDQLTEFTAPLVFFSLEVNRIPDEVMEDKLQHEGLTDELESYKHDSSPVGASAWNKLFDETVADLTFEVNGETLGLEATASLLAEKDRDTREAASREIARVLGENIKLFTRVHNTLAKMGEIDDSWRKMPTPQAGRHLSNDVEPEVVEALRNAVVAAYPKLSHRYYELKRKWLGLRQTVMDAYAGFDPKMAEIAKPFFTDGWIDAGVKPGKAPGAFAHPTVTDAHPYVMLNYLGKPRDVMTLAHELGHGVHQVLAALLDTAYTRRNGLCVWGNADLPQTACGSKKHR